MNKLKNYLILFVVFMAIQSDIQAQENSNSVTELPSITLINIKGKSINLSEISNDNNPILICFWKTCCKKPGEYLDAISEVYQDWVDETGVVLYAIAIDDVRSSNKVAPFANSHGWEFEVMFDINSEAKRAMNVALTPHTFLLNGKGEIIWQKSLYTYGDEELIYEKILQLSKN
jgi:peroxiredoxin